MKRVSVKLAFVCALTLIAVSCKKKSNNESSPEASPEPSPAPVPETHFIPAGYSDANGILAITNLITKTTNGTSTSIFSSLFANAKFTTVPNNFTAMVGAGTLSVNTSAFTQNSDSSYSNYTNFLGGNPSATWKVSGSTQIPAFNFAVKTPTVVTANSTIQVTKSAGFSFNFSNITNKDSVTVIITTPFTSTITASTPEKRYLYSAGSASFSPSDLAALPTGTCNLLVKSMKYAKDTVGGKYFYFINLTQFTQNVIVN